MNHRVVERIYYTPPPPVGSGVLFDSRDDITVNTLIKLALLGDLCCYDCPRLIGIYLSLCDLDCPSTLVAWSALLAMAF